MQAMLTLPSSKQPLLRMLHVPFILICVCIGMKAMLTLLCIGMMTLPFLVCQPG